MPTTPAGRSPVRFVRAVRRGLWAATRPVIRDARGRTVELFNSRKRLWRDPSGLEFPQADFRRVLERLERDMRARDGSSRRLMATGAQRRTFSLFVLGLGAIFCAAFLSAIVNAPRGPQRIALGVVLALVLSGIVAMRIYRRRELARTFPSGAIEVQITGAMLGEERCPSCGYHIGRVEPEMDGCTVCPECGGAWHVDRVRAVFKMGGELMDLAGARAPLNVRTPNAAPLP